ncbi:hypothetical protein E2C01_072836 [Portunus trituberculatus]|uniref:Uncharacterized protein n=1 Tax=Portunus trituberculatus TaxID=210409 RepID=A0A5B7I3M2_PORTR|nr:hypothetical protein [Portunus trituberculatus]
MPVSIIFIPELCTLPPAACKQVLCRSRKAMSQLFQDR